MYRLKLRLLLAILIGLTVILTACAGNNKDDKDDQTDSVVPDTEATPLPPTSQSLIVWHGYSGIEQETLEQIRLQFEVDHPLIDVQFVAFDSNTLLDEFIAATNAGSGPDLLLGPAAWVGVLSQQGLLWSFGQDFIDEVSSNLTRPIAETTMIDGAPFGAAFTLDMVALYYNRTLVKNLPKEYTDLVAQAAIVGMVVPPTFSATSGLYLSPGESLMDSQGNNLITLPALEKYLTDVQALAASPGITFSMDQASFLQGGAGFLLAPSTDYRRLKTALGDNLGVLRLPRIVPEEWRTLVQVDCVMLSLNTTAEAAETARPFIVFLTRSSTQRDWFNQTGLTPVNPAELEEDELREAWSSVLERVVGAPLAASFDAVVAPALDRAVQAVALEGQPPVTVAQNTLNALQSIE
ncbi:MAG: extracellular solute-binding protein [Chloroflexi bacterium]|nr:extracellular solute-binding protein [Chloroflexota bacterium]